MTFFLRAILVFGSRSDISSFNVFLRSNSPCKFFSFCFLISIKFMTDNTIIIGQVKIYTIYPYVQSLFKLLIIRFIIINIILIIINLIFINNYIFIIINFFL